DYFGKIFCVTPVGQARTVTFLASSAQGLLVLTLSDWSGIVPLALYPHQATPETSLNRSTLTDARGWWKIIGSDHQPKGETSRAVAAEDRLRLAHAGPHGAAP